jgi:GNAT superfamily N-acetyltransferase
VSDYELRRARPDDFEGLVELALASADTGRVAVSPRYLENPVEAAAAFQPDLEWVVAAGGHGLIGAGQIALGESEVEGERFRRGTLTSLMVHPDHRRQGVAKAITRWRLERAGPDAVVAAVIQSGNEGSFANSRGWATQIFGQLVLAVVDATEREPRAKGLDIREPRGDPEWELAAAGLAKFEEGWNLRTPLSAGALRERTERALDGERLARYYVAVSDGSVVGGFELFESSRLQSFVVERLPLVLRLANALTHFIPPDGEVRTSSVSRFWFEDQDVGKALWEHARFRASATGTAVATQFDARSPTAQFVRVKPWVPKGKLSLAVRSPVTLSEERLVSPP